MAAGQRISPENWAHRGEMQYALNMRHAPTKKTTPKTVQVFSPSNKVLVMSNQALAAHILFHLALAQKKGCPMTLHSLSRAVGARRADVRTVVTALHEAGYLDASTMRLSLAGFAIGCSLRSAALPALRLARPVRIVAAA